ncbi:uncharacterized protein BJ171DRAFT_474752 [Polychytrium aggregatum]|uniref:uncharacterized protein n=1 Tax=Polychytrium aggregatum TaxID=110093 RepID=UPI0022FE9B20|nr:uncharacterized protein BJ171DRAFT_474752 [Polychytrium aggregatum]KAI9204932.1 hypothetical protein BJ171DRAFT_474752 [Polychytrium aggregatum]
MDIDSLTLQEEAPSTSPVDPPASLKHQCDASSPKSDTDATIIQGSEPMQDPALAHPAELSGGDAAPVPQPETTSPEDPCRDNLPAPLQTSNSCQDTSSSADETLHSGSGSGSASASASGSNTSGTHSSSCVSEMFNPSLDPRIAEAIAQLDQMNEIKLVDRYNPPKRRSHTKAAKGQTHPYHRKDTGDSQAAPQPASQRAFPGSAIAAHDQTPADPGHEGRASAPARPQSLDALTQADRFEFVPSDSVDPHAGMTTSPEHCGAGVIPILGPSMSSELSPTGMSLSRSHSFRQDQVLYTRPLGGDTFPPRGLDASQFTRSMARSKGHIPIPGFDYGLQPMTKVINRVGCDIPTGPNRLVHSVSSLVHVPPERLSNEHSTYDPQLLHPMSMPVGYRQPSPHAQRLDGLAGLSHDLGFSTKCADDDRLRGLGGGAEFPDEQVLRQSHSMMADIHHHHQHRGELHGRGISEVDRQPPSVDRSVIAALTGHAPQNLSLVPNGPSVPGGLGAMVMPTTQPSALPPGTGPPIGLQFGPHHGGAFPPSKFTSMAHPEFPQGCPPYAIAPKHASHFVEELSAIRANAGSIAAGGLPFHGEPMMHPQAQFHAVTGHFPFSVHPPRLHLGPLWEEPMPPGNLHFYPKGHMLHPGPSPRRIPSDWWYADGIFQNYDLSNFERVMKDQYYEIETITCLKFRS